MLSRTFLPLKGALIVLLSLITSFSNAQVVEFFDDFESGTGNWVLTDLWGLTTSNSNSPTNSLTESPVGDYGNTETSYATMLNGVDLSTVLDANMSFWAIYDIEGGFDYMYVEASGDGGTTWLNIATFDGENNLTPWVQYNYSLGGFVGSSNMLVRFKFVSDGFVTEDGMYIDDFEITSNSIDNSPPLILHTGPVMHQASLSDQNVAAEIIDVSGISLAELSYMADGGAPLTVTGVNTNGDNYLFIIPALAAGTWVDYWITAVDDSDSLNMAVSDTSSYISGNYIVYDNAVIDFVNSYGPSSPAGFSGAAVAITLGGATDLVTSLIRNYTDNMRPNDSMLIHVWDDGGGAPGTDLITPFMLFPEATLSEPNRITRVDLRPYSAQLSGLSGNIFVGFTVPIGEVWVSQTTPGTALRTYVDSLGTWFTITDDYHFRAITDTLAGAPVADFTFSLVGDPLVSFTDITSNSPTSWFWDFGDGSGTSTVKSPPYTYAANGTYNVCLTATNSVGSSTTCQLVTISNVPTLSNFSANDTNFCQGTCVNFTDMSTNNPLTWNWSFPGGTPSSDTTQNPSVCYNTAGIYDVILIVSNGGGADTLTLTSYITATTCPPPVAGFSSATSVCVGDGVIFTDQSTNTPTSWAWNMVGATPDTSTMQNPIMIYNTVGTYSVTLIVINPNGTDTLTMSNYITVNPIPAKPTISVGGSTTFCQGDSIMLTSSSGTGNLWSNGMTNQILFVTSAGDYSVTVTDGNGCSAISDTTTTMVNAAPATPTITANGPTTFCDGGSVTLTSSSTSGNVWSTSDTTESITVSSVSSITVSVVDSNGCSSLASAVTTIATNPNPPVPSIQANGNVLTADLSSAYQWYMDSTLITGATFQNYTIPQSGTYSVAVIDINGCSTLSAPFTGTYTTIGELEEAVHFNVFPVPSDGNIQIVLETVENETYTLELTNIVGELIYSRNLENLSGQFHYTFNLSEYGPGVYFVKLNNGAEGFSRKVIVY